MFGGFFDMDKPFWRWMGKIPDLILLSLCWYICCLPVITIIPASCALFDAVSRNLMMDDKGIYKRYFRSFVRELKMGIPLSILWAAIGFIAWYGDNVIAYNAQNNEVFAIYSIVYRIMILMMFAYLGWLVPLESRYYNSFGKLHINAFRFFLGKLPSTGLIILIPIAVVMVVFLHQLTMCLLVVAPALIAVFHSLIIERAFMAVFPNDYEDGLPVYTEQDRESYKAIKKAKQEEAQNKKDGY